MATFALDVIEGVPVVSRTLPDGRRIDVYLLLFGAGRLGITKPDYDDGGYADVWDYESWDGALAAMEGWDPVTAPELSGWYRHPHSGRRRPGGEASKEYVSD